MELEQEYEWFYQKWFEMQATNKALEKALSLNPGKFNNEKKLVGFLAL
jgi:hypothetical protein